MGNSQNLGIFRPGHGHGCGIPGSGGCPLLRFLAILLLVATCLPLPGATAAETGPGFIIYTTLDHGRDETAIALPFVKAEQFALVTNVTTPEGKSIRVTNNQLKEIVPLLDLSRLTVVDAQGLQALNGKVQSLRSLQRRFPRAAGSLEIIAGELERIGQVIESGNILDEGRIVPRADYEKQVAASRGTVIDITLNGRVYRQAKLSSVGDGKISITHADGVTSLPTDSLSDEAIAMLNETSTGPRIDIPAPTVPPAPPLIVDTPLKPEVSQPPVPQVTVAATAPSSALRDMAAPSSLSSPPPSAPARAAVPATAPPTTPITLAAIRTLLRECERHIQIQREGHAAMADLQNFPGGRFGSMKYDDAMQESRFQQARLDLAVSEQATLKDKLHRLGTSSPDDARVPEGLRKRLQHLAALSADTVEDLTGILWLGGELPALLTELEKVAPEEAVPGQDTTMPAVRGGLSAGPPSGETSAPVLALPNRGVPPLTFVVAGLLAFAATAGIFLVQRRTEIIVASSCPRCQSHDQNSISKEGEPLTCGACHHEYVATAPPRSESPGPLVYSGVALGSLLLLAGLLLQVELASTTLADHSSYDVSDYPFDLQPVRQRAESGDTAAAYELGRFHDWGADDFPADPREAALWYLVAAEGGDHSAQLAIGTLYEMGHGIEPDPEEAEHWLTAAAEQGDVEAQKTLGVLYLGKGSLPYEPERSIEWMTRAAEQGDGEAMFHLSVAYHKGVEVAPDLEASEGWMQRAVEAGFGPAAKILQLRQENMEAQVDQMWRQAVESMPRSSGIYTNPYTQNIPPQYR